MSTGPTPAPQYKPGDVVNGHVLTDQGQWVPNGPPPPEPGQYQPGPRQYQPGPGPGQYGATAVVAQKAKKPLWKRWWFILLAAIVLIAILNSFKGGGDDPVAEEEPAAIEEPAEEPAEEEPTEELAEEAPAVEAVIGTAVRDGKFEFVVTGVERVGATIGEGFSQETAQGEFVIIRMDVTNIGDEAQTLSSSGQVLYNDKDQKFEPSSAIFSLPDADKFFLEKINPGNKVVGAPLLFDVAPGTVLNKIELHDSVFSGGVEVSLAGS
jgi:hypothetical protein